MDKIDITMTATIRPKIIENTLIDIKKYIIGKKVNDRFQLIMNLDNIGEADVHPENIISMVKKYFPNLIYRISNQPSFAKAVKWVWSQTKHNFIFHIEDDWSFNRKIDVDDMIRILNKHTNLSSLRLYKMNTPKKEVFKTFECKWRYNKDDGFYLADDWTKQFGLNPILIKKQFIDEALPRMVDHVNPEKQFRSSQKYMVDLIEKYKYGLYTKPGERASVRDTGRYWITTQPFTKPKKQTFINWVKRG